MVAFLESFVPNSAYLAELEGFLTSVDLVYSLLEKEHSEEEGAADAAEELELLKH